MPHSAMHIVYCCILHTSDSYLQDGCTPLYEASRTGVIDVVKLLQRHHADHSINDEVSYLIIVVMLVEIFYLLFVIPFSIHWAHIKPSVYIYYCNS